MEFLQPELQNNFLPGLGGIRWDSGLFLRKYGWSVSVDGEMNVKRRTRSTRCNSAWAGTRLILNSFAGPFIPFCPPLRVL